MLYAYRWQVELFFRVLKRTFNALHLWTHHERGIQSQFYIYLIVYVLLIHFKQKLNQTAKPEINTEKTKTSKRSSHAFSSSAPERGIVTFLGEKLNEYWKIGIHWLKTIQNLLRCPLIPEHIEILISMK